MVFARSRVPESRQPAVIAAVMIAVLAASLLVTYGLAVHQPAPVRAQVAGLEVSLPAGWAASPDVPAHPGLVEAAVYHDPAQPGRRLLIAADAGSRPRSPVVALNGALHLILADEVQKGLESVQPVQRFRAGTVVGAWYAGVARSDAHHSLHLVAVLSEDAKAYWVVSFSDTTEGPGGLADRMDRGGALFQSVIHSARNRTMRDATGEDLAAARLVADPAAVDAGGSAPASSPWPEGIDARVEAGGPPGVAVLAVPRNVGSAVAYLRLLGMDDLEGVDPQRGLSPAGHLERHLQKVLGLSTGAGHPGLGVWAGRAGGYPVWRVAYPLAGGTLHRQLWYAQLGGGRGLLVEVLAEPPAVHQAAEWVVPLIEACAGGRAPSPPSPPSPASEASEADTDDAARVLEDRGKVLVGHQRDFLAAGAADPSEPLGYRVSADGSAAGFYIERPISAPEGGEAPTKVAGESVMVIAVRGEPIEIDQQWAAGADGSAFVYTTRRARVRAGQPDDPLVAVSRMEGNGQTLRLRRVLPKPEADLWKVPVPDYFLPPMLENHWSPQSLSALGPGPALVWMTPGDAPPEPFWVRLGRADPDRGEQEVLIRPMVGLDLDRLTVDRTGRMIRFSSRQFTNGFGGAEVVLDRVELKELFDLYPSLRSHFEQQEDNAESQG